MPIIGVFGEDMESYGDEADGTKKAKGIFGDKRKGHQKYSWR